MIALLPMALAGCDPGGPGASGTVTLGAGVDPAAFAILELRAFAPAGATYAPATNDIAGQPGLFRKSIPLAGITFPCDYELGGGLGGPVGCVARLEVGDRART